MKPIIFTLFSHKEIFPFQKSNILESSVLEPEPQLAGIVKFGVC